VRTALQDAGIDYDSAESRRRPRRLEDLDDVQNVSDSGSNDRHLRRAEVIRGYSLTLPSSP
jgi:hypothetical protein